MAYTVIAECLGARNDGQDQQRRDVAGELSRREGIRVELASGSAGSLPAAAYAAR